jgi:hypothetical protein
MSSLIDRLPNELHHNILSNLDSSILQPCRLVCRQWTNISNEYFLPAVYFSEPTDFPRFLAIAKHDCIARHIQSITFTKNFFGKEQQKVRTEDEQSARGPLSVRQDANIGDGDTNLLYSSHLLHEFRKLEKLTISDSRDFETLEWECMACNSMATGQLALREDPIARQLVMLQAAIASASIRLKELRVEWFNTKFSLSGGADIGQNWKLLTVLRLGILHDEESHGIEDLRVVIGQLANLRQLHLSSVGQHRTHLDALVNSREIAWDGLTDLTLQRFVVEEWTLQRLLNIPSMESTSLYNIELEYGGCWRSIMTSLQKKKFERVCLSGWLANGTEDEGWGGEGLLQEVAEWYMRDVQNKGKCPLTTESMNL